MAKKYYMVLDVETVADARVPYDIAWMIIDRNGCIVERFNALTDETMNNPTMRYILTHDSFAKNKAQFYLKETNAPIMSFYDVMKTTTDAIKRYNAIVVAYNAQFDIKVLNNYARALFDCNFFDMNETIFWDLMTIAVNIFADSRNYVTFAAVHGFLTDKGNIRANAEAIYGYITNNPDFVEAHTAFADVDIEAQILLEAFKRKQKLQTAIKPIHANKVWQKRLKR